MHQDFTVFAVFDRTNIEGCLVGQILRRQSATEELEELG